MQKHYVKIFYPSLKFDLFETRAVEARSDDLELVPGAEGFRYFSRTEVELDGELLCGSPKDLGPRPIGESG